MVLIQIVIFQMEVLQVIFLLNKKIINSFKGVSWSELAATATSCQDEYQAVITWSNAKTLCGFTNVGKFFILF